MRQNLTFERRACLKMDTELSLLFHLIMYLEKSNQLERILKDLMWKLQDQRGEIGNLVISISLHELIEASSALGSLFFHNYIKIEQLLQEIVFSLAVVSDTITDDEDPNRIHIQVQLTDFPCVKETQHVRSVLESNRIQVCTGTIMALSRVRQKTRCMCYRCPDSCCPGSAELKLTESVRSIGKRRRLTCTYCQLELQEELQKRHFKESMEFLLLLDSENDDGLFSETRKSRRRALLCTVYDDMIKRVHIGEQCFISGIPELRFIETGFQWVMNVNNVQSKRETWRDLGKCTWNTVVEQFPDYVFHSRFGISFVLAYLFLGNITPPGTLFLLKWLLLLLLTHLNAAENQTPQEMNEEPQTIQSGYSPLSLLVLNPTACPSVQRLIRAATNYAHPFWEHRPGNQLKTTSSATGLGVQNGTHHLNGIGAIDVITSLTSDTSHVFKARTGPRLSHRNDEHMKYCGTLELAQGGLAYFPSIELLKTKELASLTYALETNSSDQFNNSGSKVLSTKKLETSRCCTQNGSSIWATTELNPLKKHSNLAVRVHLSGDDLSPKSNTNDSASLAVELLPRRSGLKKAISAFDIVVDAELALGPSEIVDSLLADMCLNKSVGLAQGGCESTDPEYGNSVIYTSVFDACSSTVIAPLPDNVSRLLRVYFLAIRRACSADRYIVPCSALESLFKLTKSNARLNGRTNTEEVDALVAVYLYDTFVQSLTGTNYLGMRAIHYTKGVDRESMNELDEVLQSIYSQLKGLIEIGFDQNGA
ncbi:hypothetical protein FGIG_08136 [Fasciola gigantica]|uniref:MCMDC2 N-terminal domain-containing protein n=1 Tax=Fasciola gigantica TaxID=46835 RepID=A0A504YTS5_FASGI|nr:hypothetical protein FGIG_08136 [Fasciola gigantica]